MTLTVTVWERQRPWEAHKGTQRQRHKMRYDGTVVFIDTGGAYRILYSNYETIPPTGKRNMQAGSGRAKRGSEMTEKVKSVMEIEYIDM